MHRLVTAAALMTCLQAQPPTEAQLNKLYAQIDDVLGLHPGATIADIGTGFAVDHALRMAEKVGPGGKIVCVDVKQPVLTKIKDQASARHVTNLEVLLGGDDDPRLPLGAFDAILISNTYHEFTQPAAMLKRLSAALKPGGKLVIVENCSIAHRGASRAEQTKLHDLSPELLERELTAEGLEVKNRIEPILVETSDRFRYLFTAELKAPAHATADVWERVRFLIGTWEGEVNGQPGTGMSEREYHFALNNKYLEVRNKSVYPAQPKNPKGQVHEDWGMISYDRSRKKLVLRQFHVEGYVNQFVSEASPDGGIRFQSEAIENIPAGYRARETYTITGPNEFVERFELAEPGKDFEPYSETRFKRKS